MHDYFFVGFQEVDDTTEEKIQDELNAIKEAHAADEGNFFILCSRVLYLKLKVNLIFQFILSGSYILHFVENFAIGDIECTCLWMICSCIVLTICCLIYVCCRVSR